LPKGERGLAEVFGITLGAEDSQLRKAS
jgi:hypothetical protein